MTYVTGDCPACKKNDSFGNVNIHNNLVLQGCSYCNYSIRIPLPSIQKKILYLDQFVFSNFFQNEEHRYQEALDLIKRATKMQLLVVPYSSVHEDETQQWRGHGGKTKEELFEFIRNLSFECRFRLSAEVQRVQIIKAFKSFLNSGPFEYILKHQDAFEDEIHKWDNYFEIGVNLYSSEVELIRELKTRATETLVDLFDEWRGSSTTFAEDELSELKAAGQNYLSSYNRFLKRITAGDFNALSDAPMSSMVVQSMLEMMQKEIPAEKKIEKIANFFNSEYFYHLPYQELSTKIFAKLQEMVKHGAFQNHEVANKRLRGLYYDIEHIATYAPYCDAIVIDNPMAEIVRDSRINLSQKYGVKVFSLNSWDEFLEWINSLEAEMTEVHKRALAIAYPD